MSVEIVAHQPDLVGCGVMVIEQMFHLMRPIHASALLAHGNRTPPGQGLSEQTDVGRADPCIFVIIVRWLAGLGGQGLASFLDQLDTLLSGKEQACQGDIRQDFR